MIKNMFLTIAVAAATALGTVAGNAPQVRTVNGILEGEECSGVKVFKGVPFAAAPVGELRWKAPQPAKNWDGVRKAVSFGPNPMQENIFGDMMSQTAQLSTNGRNLSVRRMHSS